MESPVNSLKFVISYNVNNILHWINIFHEMERLRDYVSPLFSIILLNVLAGDKVRKEISLRYASQLKMFTNCTCTRLGMDTARIQDF